MAKEIYNSQNTDRPLIKPVYSGIQGVFLELYQGYAKSRDKLHSYELSGQDTTIQKDEALFYKEFLANLTFAMYSHFGSFSDFRNTMLNLVDHIEENRGESSPHITEYSRPLSLKDLDIPSPVESIVATLENLAIIDEFKNIAQTHADGMLFSGSNAWGPFYGVRGEPKGRQNLGQQQQNVYPSDVDLLITAESIDKLSLTLRDLVSSGLLRPSEIKRFDMFMKLYAENKVDTFWTTGNYKKSQEIHFITLDIIRKIASMQRINQSLEDEDKTDFVRVLRPNIPKSLEKFGGYSTVDIKGLKDIFFVPQTTPVTLDDGVTEAFVSQMTIGGPARIGDKKTYYVGVIPFFLLISPRILIDNGNLLSKELLRFKEAVMNIVEDDNAILLPRQERMSNSMETRIKNSFKHW